MGNIKINRRGWPVITMSKPSPFHLAIPVKEITNSHGGLMYASISHLSKWLISLLVLFCVISSCSRATKINISDKLDYQEVARQVLGSGVKFIENESGEFFLCIKKSGEIGIKSLSYMVLMKNGKVLVPESKVSGSVSWIGKDLLKINPTDRVPKNRADESDGDWADNSFILNVKTNQRVKEPKSKI